MPFCYGGGITNRNVSHNAVYKMNYSGYGRPQLAGYIMLPSRLKTGNNALSKINGCPFSL